MFETPAGVVRLRPETPEDLPFLRRLYASTREEELAPVPWTLEQKQAFLESQFELQHRHYREHYAGARFDVVELEGQPVGRIYVHRTPQEVRLMDIALLPEHRGKGIGGMLMGNLLEQARRAGQSVTLHVEENNPARLWYERLGFERLEERGVYWFMRWRAAPG
ncbi:GNAT family N-acetyltransferase [Calidithermus chliarophilus]|uniref:GNAT family N-acetyltransferase n=1 Tax=Calidithermus chliarophilus TaxID=52023 RepID=UPI00041A30F6|nr:GNAT family N-acetyltransferase [Calidithermus chliarophilus]